MKLLNKMWALAIAFDLGALLVGVANQYAATLSTFIIWAVVIIMATILTLCTVQVKRMEPRKKKLPVRRASRVVRRNVRIAR